MESATIKRRKGSKHDKTGCLTCRYRRKKCTQNTFPRCGACIRLNLECVRDAVRRINPHAHNDVSQSELVEVQSSTPQIVLTTELSSLPPVDLNSPKRRQAMNHYIRVLSELLAISLNSNSFLSKFLPLAMESPALAEALIAYSSGHMSYADPSYTTVSLTARSKALNKLSMALCHPTDSAVTETALSACLILLTSEVCLGSHQSWYNHLVGAKHLIACARSNSGAEGAQALRLTSEGRWILRNFAYHDIIASVTLGTQP
ncbi:fungal-specific transcription factor domain-containing protein [Fusarium avenaceum]|nr:fungal-specific transcription factor domain-containing protein [Fusarium avenaceum]